MKKKYYNEWIDEGKTIPESMIIVIRTRGKSLNKEKNGNKTYTIVIIASKNLRIITYKGLRNYQGARLWLTDDDITSGIVNISLNPKVINESKYEIIINWRIKDNDLTINASR